MRETRRNTFHMRALYATATLVVIAAICAFPAPASAATTARSGSLTITADLRGWLPDFDGNIQVDTDMVSGTRVRFDKTLDLEERPEVYEIGLSLGEVRTGKLSFSYMLFNAPGDKVLVTDIVFGGESFFAPETVHSEFEMSMTRLSLSYVQSNNGGYTLVYEVGMTQLNWSLGIHNRHNGHSVSEKGSHSLPLTGLHAIFNLGMFQIRLGVSGVFFQTTDDDVTITESYGEIDYLLAQFVVLGLGYRHFRVDAILDLDGNREGEMAYTLGGVYLNIGIKF